MVVAPPPIGYDYEMVSDPQSAEPSAETYYRLDMRDRIIEAGGAWDEFACANGGGGIVNNRIIGTPLYSHITGKATRDCMRMMFDMVRTFKRSLVKPYRCDSSEIARFMEMTISHDHSGALNVGHRLIRSEPLTSRVQFQIHRGLQADLMCCSMCNRVSSRTHTDWKEPAALVSNGVLAQGSTAKVIYTVCTDCRAVCADTR